MNKRKPFALLKYIIILSAIAILQSCQTTQMSSEGGLSWKNKLKIADKLFKEQYFYDAAHYYEEIHKDQPNDVDIAYKLAEAYFYSRDYKQAQVLYKLVAENNYKKIDFYFPLVRYKYALTLKMNGLYERSKPEFENFIETYRGDDYRIYKQRVENEIAGCDFALKAIKKPISVKIEHLKGVNAAYTESAPFPLGDMLLYSSLRSDTVITLEKGKSMKYHFRIYQSKKERGKWSKGELLPDIINVNNTNVANGTFSPDLKNFYFTQCEENEKGNLICAIYQTSYENGKWSNRVKLNELINMPEYTSTHPTIAPYKKGQQILYFVSDRPGGMGGLDLWYAVITKEGAFSVRNKPRNAGKKINTVNDELTPYYDPKSNILYFSSNGHPSLGGYDIFMTEGKLRKWSDPENIGYPINSSVDDMYFVTEGKGGYLVSNRPGVIALKSETCCDDIFRFDWLKIIIIAVEGFAYDEDIANKSSLARLYLLNQDGGVAVTGILNEDGYFMFEKLPYYENNIFALDDKDIELLKGKGSPVKLNLLNQNGDTLMTSISNKEGYFVFDNIPHSGNLIFALNAEDVKLISENRRSKYTPLEKIKTQLFLIDKDSSEVLIAELAPGKETHSFFTLKQNRNYKIVKSAKGYFSNYTLLSTVGIEESDTLHVKIPLKKLEFNKSIVLKDVYYDFDKATLRSVSNRTLATLTMILKENPTIIVELSSHTDSRGEELYNQKLSQKRAESVVRYLKKAGISKERLVAKGYGESKPIAPNTHPDGTDNPEGRQFNRRTEIKVIGKLDMKIEKETVKIEDIMEE